MMSEFGTLIRSIREEKGLSFADLSRLITDKSGTRISRAQLCMLESGSRICTLSLAYDISRGLEVDLQTFVSAAFRDRLAYAYQRETEGLELFTRKNRLEKTLDISRILQG